MKDNINKDIEHVLNQIKDRRPFSLSDEQCFYNIINELEEKTKQIDELSDKLNKFKHVLFFYAKSTVLKLILDKGKRAKKVLYE